MTRGLLFASSVLAALAPAPAAQVRWSDDILRQQPAWYATAEARAIADSVVLYQSPQGGWPKNTDLAAPPQSPTDRLAPDDDRANTIDNGATTTPMRFLALLVQATNEPKYRRAFERGMDYLLAAQYPNGGWPQYFPLREGYYSRITYNDHAMVNVLTLLRDAAAGRSPYGFVDAPRRARARDAVARGVDVILRTQVTQGGRLTAWCAQHDEKTLAPAWARTYEPPSLSGNESVGIVRFLMEIDRPTPEIVAAVEGAVAWLQTVVIKGVRLERVRGAGGRMDRRLVADSSAPPLWARFYELGTNRPLYLDRDSVFRYDFAEIGYERRSGYEYLGTWPASLLDRDYPRWRKTHAAAFFGRLPVPEDCYIPEHRFVVRVPPRRPGTARPARGSHAPERCILPIDRLACDSPAVGLHGA